MLIEPAIAKQFLKQYQSFLAASFGSVPATIAEWIVARKMMLDGIQNEDLKSPSANSGAEFLDSLKNAVYGDFIFLKRYKNYCVMLHCASDMYYAVRSLTTPIEEFVPEYSMIFTGIVPFRGLLVCDGLIESKNVLLGMSFAKSVRDGYWNAKRSGTLMTTIGTPRTAQADAADTLKRVAAP